VVKEKLHLPKNKRLTVTCSTGVKEMSKMASKGARNGSYCPGNERCEVIIYALILLRDWAN